MKIIVFSTLLALAVVGSHAALKSSLRIGGSPLHGVLSTSQQQPKQQMQIESPQQSQSQSQSEQQAHSQQHSAMIFQKLPQADSFYDEQTDQINKQDNTIVLYDKDDDVDSSISNEDSSSFDEDEYRRIAFGHYYGQQSGYDNADIYGRHQNNYGKPSYDSRRKAHHGKYIDEQQNVYVGHQPGYAGYQSGYGGYHSGRQGKYGSQQGGYGKPFYSVYGDQQLGYNNQPIYTGVHSGH